VRLFSAASNSSKWIINRDFVGWSEIFVDHLQITPIEGAIELSQSLLRLPASPTGRIFSTPPSARCSAAAATECRLPW
jgi:hypothetical protein